MLDALSDLLNGPAGRGILTALHALLLVFTALFVFRLAGASRRAAKSGGTPRGAASGKAKRRDNKADFRALSRGVGLALAAVLAYQGVWQLTGFRSRGLQRFMRGHNMRQGAADKQVLRGSILDANGEILARTSPETVWRRSYPLGPAAAHVVGYAHPVYGWSGVERAADAALSGCGVAGGDELSRLGRNMLDLKRPEGTDVRITLDARLQRAAYDLLAGRAGAVVALRPSDGAILAMASSPSFDPAQPASGLRGRSAPMLNRTAQGLYPPGSTFKIAMALLASDLGIAPRFDCPAEGFRAEPKAQPIRDSEYTSWKRQGRTWTGWGVIGLADGFVHSSNVYFARLGTHLGPAAFNAFIDRLGIRDNVVFFDSGDGIIQASPAHVPELGEKDRRALAQMSIGQGEMLLAPLHVAMLTAAVANRGELATPRLKAALPPGGPKAKRIVSAKAADAVKAMMRDAVGRGTGRGAHLPGLDVCGKTGTAQAPGGDDHAWFTCFAPGKNPKIVVTVIVERGGYGAKSAVPVARALLEKADELGLLR
jgi:peptidoglycan glycosyltransferase